MSEQPRDALARPWWPGQWLRIVYGVWVDQLWYWQNVRPRLRGRTEGWAIFAQAALGAALVTVLVAAPTVWALGAAGRSEVLPPVGFGLVLFVIVATVIGRAHGVADSLALCVAGAPVIAVVMNLGFAVILGGGWDALASSKSLAVGALRSVGIGLAGGWARGIYGGLTSGAVGRMRDIADDAALFGVGGGIARNLAAYAVGIVACFLAFLGGYWLGVRWSTRQVRDEEARRHLANPEVKREREPSQ